MPLLQDAVKTHAFNLLMMLGPLRHEGACPCCGSCGQVFWDVPSGSSPIDMKGPLLMLIQLSCSLPVHGLHIVLPSLDRSSIAGDL